MAPHLSHPGPGRLHHTGRGRRPYRPDRGHRRPHAPQQHGRRGGPRRPRRPGSTVVDMSSSDPMSTQRLAASLEARGVTLLDARVSDGGKGAENGRLTIMVGGAEDDVKRLPPLLATMGTARRACEVGAGRTLKAINNLLSATLCSPRPRAYSPVSASGSTRRSRQRVPELRAARPL
ncbi:NAD(P)-binding domain-containing protein [Streptomyces sp. NPDC001351]|uniref:NAD(P)-binding domain-containing protein n=1 Tax=Streptomyces sp. NPDC001351 TaxID=3364564 RepID=UPI0036A9C3CA